jgi:hypothetical protein
MLALRTVTRVELSSSLFRVVSRVRSGHPLAHRHPVNFALHEDRATKSVSLIGLTIADVNVADFCLELVVTLSAKNGTCQRVRKTLRTYCTSRRDSPHLLLRMDVGRCRFGET